MFLAVSPTLPSRNLAEFLDHVAANPGKYNSGSSNSASELAMLQLLGTKNAKVVNARYKGDTQAITDLVSGSIQMMFSTGTLTPAFVKEGKIKALVTLLPQRSPLLPDVPTASELGIGKLTITPWAGFFGPPNLPPEITEKLSAGLRATLARARRARPAGGAGLLQLRHDTRRIWRVPSQAVRRLRRDRAREQRQVRLTPRPISPAAHPRGIPCPRPRSQGLTCLRKTRRA